MDAKDWFRVRLFPTDEYTRSKFSWESFLRLAVYCSNIQGSALYDATLGDDSLIEDMYRDAVREQSAKRKKPVSEHLEQRPPRRGYTREVEAIYDLHDSIVALRAESGRWSCTQAERLAARRPWFPAEVVADRMRARARARRDAAITAAMKRWSTGNAR